MQMRAKDIPNTQQSGQWSNKTIWYHAADDQHHPTISPPMGEAQMQFFTNTVEIDLSRHTYQSCKSHQRSLYLSHVSILKKIICFKYVMRLHAISLDSLNEVANILQL